MIQTRYKILNWLTITLLLAVFCGLQSSFWYQLTGGAPAPQLWLLLILYLALYRTYIQAMISVYALSLVIKAFSAVPLSMLWSTLFLVVTASSFIKGRMFWSNTRYFVIAAASFVTSFNLIYYVLSKLIEENSVTLSFFTRLAEIALTTLCAAPVYWLLLAIDKWTLPEVVERKRVSE